MSSNNIDTESKVCNVCGEDKPRTEFRVNRRCCKKCQYATNKAYAKNYYQQHKTRLIKMNIENYKIRNPNPNKNGRPRKYEPEEMVISC